MGGSVLHPDFSASGEPSRWLQMMRLQELADGRHEEQRVPGAGAATGNLSRCIPLLSQPLAAVSCPAGSEHTAKPTKESPGPEKQKRGQQAPGMVERPVRDDRNRTGLCCVTTGK